MKQKLREEISNEYKWDLEAIYGNKEEFEDELKKIEQESDFPKIYRILKFRIL